MATEQIGSPEGDFAIDLDGAGENGGFRMEVRPRVERTVRAVLLS